MHRRTLLTPLFLILFASVQTVADYDCALDVVMCTEYIVKSKLCLNLSGCMNYPRDTTSVVWYRCQLTRLLHMNDSLCQSREVINTSTGSNGPLYVTPEGRPCFRELNKTYTGLYCYETTSNSTCNPVQVVIVEKPEIKAVSNVTVVTGGIVEQNIAMLQCYRPVEGCPATIQWKYQERILSNAGRFTIITTPAYTSLIINNVTINDSGIYECEVLDEYDGEKYTEQISLIVSNAIIQVINASLCSDKQLTCNNLTDNPNPQYQWTHHEVNISNNNGSLNLLKIKPTDFGLYNCWLTPSPYGSVVTQLLVLQQTAAPLMSDYVFLLIHHQNYSHLDTNQIGSSLQFHVNNLCGSCCDVTIVMGLLWPCQCNDSTSVYTFKLNGTLAMTMYTLLEDYFASRTTVLEGNLTFSMCDNNCCQLCDIRGSHDESSDLSNETELALTVTMAALIVVLLTMMIIILLSYQWYRKRVPITTNDQNEKEHVATVSSHGNNINGHVQIGVDGHYDKLIHHHHNNTSRANISYESLS